jgi:multiple sugar transport system permease protein
MSASLSMARRGAGRSIVTLVLFAGVFVVVFPLLWMVVSSFRSPQGFMTTELSRSFPGSLDLSTYRLAFSRTELPTWLVNSLVVSLTTTLAAVVVAVPYAYALSRLQFRGKRLANLSLALAYSVPSVTIAIPLVVILSKLSLVNSLLGLILVHMTFAIPFATWVLRSSVTEIPSEIEEAARVDGASTLQLLIRIVIPLLVPGILAAGSYAFILSWNDFLFSLILISDPELFTIPVGVRAYFTGSNATESTWAQLMAASVVVSLPAAMLFGIFQRFLTSGFLSGSVKG